MLKLRAGSRRVFRNDGGLNEPSVGEIGERGVEGREDVTDS